MDMDYERELGALQESVDSIKDNTKKILHVLNGNGSEGLVTKTALNRQSITRIWWWLGIVSVCFLGICGFVIKSLISQSGGA